MSVPSAGVGANWHSGVRGGKRIGVEQDVRVCTVALGTEGAEGTDPVSSVPLALLLVSELGRGERQDLWASESHGT